MISALDPTGVYWLYVEGTTWCSTMRKKKKIVVSVNHCSFQVVVKAAGIFPFWNCRPLIVNLISVKNNAFTLLFLDASRAELSI